jgi:hypothetical protein
MSDFSTRITPKYCVQIVSGWSNDLLNFAFESNTKALTLNVYNPYQMQSMTTINKNVHELLSFDEQATWPTKIQGKQLTI